MDLWASAMAKNFPKRFIIDAVSVREIKKLMDYLPLKALFNILESPTYWDEYIGRMMKLFKQELNYFVIGFGLE